MKVYFINKTKKGKLITLFLMAVVFLSYGQEKAMENADEAFEGKSYIEAAMIYEKVFDKGFKSEALLKNLGDSYYFNSKYKEASKWYGELFQLNENQKNIYVLRYAQSLKATGKAQQGKRYYDKYLEKVGKTETPLVSTANYLELIEKNSGRYTINKLPFNTKGIDFGTTLLGKDRLIFASTRNLYLLRNKVSSWDGLPYLDLYEVSIEKDSVFGKPKPLKGEVNNKYHESTACFTKDGKTMYFTRTSPKKVEKGGNILHLKIFKASLVNNKWTDIKELSINGEHFNTAHPALNASENKLYFASDRPGGNGETDLYFVPINDNGSFGGVKNLGNRVNTPGRESFPFVSEDGDLYFSSDGHYGLGGYDVFYIKADKQENGFVESVLNVGKPINSSFDDICYVVYGKKGYVSSNRSDSGQGYDNIYNFTENTPIKNVYIKSQLHGVVTDKKTGLPLEGAIIKVFKEDNVLLYTLQTDQNGMYSIDVAYNLAYILNVTRDGYDGGDDFSKGVQEDRKHDFQLNPVNKNIGTGTNLAEVLNIPSIYFDFDKWEIRPDAEVDLQKIVETMKLYPKLKIEIRSHTDSRGNDAYNMVLSTERAKSTKEYLIDHGISRGRLTLNGFGETQLTNKCSNGVSCSKEEHQKNRRTEFVIVN